MRKYSTLAVTFLVIALIVDACQAVVSPLGTFDVIKYAEGAGDLEFQFELKLQPDGVLESFALGHLDHLQTGLPTQYIPGNWDIVELASPGWVLSAIYVTGSAYDLIPNGVTLHLGTNDNALVTFVNEPTPIPAPGAILISGVGVGLVGWLRRRKTL